MLDRLEEVLRHAGAHALARQTQLATLSVHRKGRLDFVTEVDRDIEAMLSTEILRLFPDDGFVGEEGRRKPAQSATTWVVDPLDGTHNFISGGRSWAISVGVVRNGYPIAGSIYAPAENVFLTADVDAEVSINGLPLSAGIRTDATIAHIGVSAWMPSSYDRWLVGYLKDGLGLDYRRTGSATSSLLAVIQGQADLYVGFGEHAWDVAAGAALAASAGLSHNLDWRGGVPEEAITIVCGHRALCKKTISALARAEPALAVNRPPRPVAAAG